MIRFEVHEDVISGRIRVTIRLGRLPLEPLKDFFEGYKGKGIRLNQLQELLPGENIRIVESLIVLCAMLGPVHQTILNQSALQVYFE